MLDSGINSNNNQVYPLPQTNHHHSNKETALLYRAVKGDKHAFSQLIEMHYADIYRISFHLTKHKTDAEDLTQDVVIKIAGAIGQFQFNSALLTWIYKIVLNTFKDQQKKQRNKIKRDQHYYQDFQLQQHSPQPDEPLYYNELLSAIDELPEKLRLTLILIYAEHLSHAQAAQILQCSTNTVSWRVHEARKQLKVILEKQS